MRKRDERILIVDDSEDVLDWMTFVLENAGYLVTRASDGVEAFDRIRMIVRTS